MRSGPLAPPGRLEAVLRKCRVHAPESRAWTVDLADLGGIASFAERASSELGGIDVLVNNAGIPKRKTVFALTPDIVESVMQINYASPVRLTLALLDDLVARTGRLVYVSSVAARLSPPAESGQAGSSPRAPRPDRSCATRRRRRRSA